MTWLDLRLEIGAEFALFAPTQWSVLTGAFYGQLRIRSPRYWDNRGELYAPRTQSAKYQWQADVINRRLKLESEKWERDIRRRRLMRDRTHCAGCGQPLDHEGRSHVRTYCGLQCRYFADRKRAASIEREQERRTCPICCYTFLVDKHAQKKICGSEACKRERRARYNRARKGAA